MSHNKIGRRTMLAAMLGMGGGLILAGPAAAQRRRGRPVVAPGTAATALRNSDFYRDGKFLEEEAKKAYLAMLERAGYPVSDNLKKNLAVTDFALGRFTEVGLGTVVWISEKKSNYTSLDIFLLPGQMIPEHWHVAVEKDTVAPKMESWLVRWGSSYIVGEGEPTPVPAVKIPESEAKFLTVKKGKLYNVGEVTGISKTLEKHWQEAGPQGAIITEVSTYHDGSAVRFTNPGIKF